MPLLIRPAGPGDLATLVDFNRRLARETEGKELDGDLLTKGVSAALADARKALYFVAEENGVILGQIMLTGEWSDWRNGWIWWIQSVYVQPDARRQGLFRKLYRHVLEEASRTPDVIGLRLYVERENQPAQQTYANLGMEATSYLVFERYPLTP